MVRVPRVIAAAALRELHSRQEEAAGEQGHRRAVQCRDSREQPPSGLALHPRPPLRGRHHLLRREGVRDVTDSLPILPI